MLNVDIGGVKGSDKIPKEVLKNWTSLDIRPTAEFVYDLNSGKPFPFKDDMVDNYYTSHTLEHIQPRFMKHVCREMHRTLKPGGLLRIVVPDITIGVDWFLNDQQKLFQPDNPSAPNLKDYPSTALGKLMLWFYTIETEQAGGYVTHGHKMVFDFDTLSFYLQDAKFKNILKKSCNQCSAAFNGKDFARYASFGLYVECQK